MPGSTEQEAMLRMCEDKIEELIQAQEAIPGHIETLEAFTINEIADDVKKFTLLVNEASTAFICSIC